MIHELKILPKYFDDIRYGKKRFELRRNDRDFKVGDYLALNEFDTSYTGRTELVKVVYILNTRDVMETRDEFVVMSIVRLANSEHYDREEDKHG